MTEFLLCILVTTCIGAGFKLFGQYGIGTFNAIVINYAVCLILGTLIDPQAHLPFSWATLQKPWFKFDLILGLLFIGGFYLTAISIQKTGITLTTLMQRMSIVLTVSFAVWIFHEHFGWLEAIGLLLAIAAILAINQKGKDPSKTRTTAFPPILLAVLLIAATIEILLLYVEKSGVTGNDQMAFTTHGFGCAAVFGLLTLLWTAWRQTYALPIKDVMAGVLLGLPNYFSIYLLLSMLNHGWKGSVMYPMVNLSVLLLSTGVAVLIFKEKLNRLNWVGILLASMAILIIAFAHNYPDWKISF